MRPLDDITVAELGGRYAVGACGSLLAHLGAKVLYVEADDLPGDKWAHRSTFALGKEPLPADKRAAAINRADIILTSSDIDGDTTLFEESIHIDITAFGHSSYFLFFVHGFPEMVVKCRLHHFYAKQRLMRLMNYAR